MFYFSACLVKLSFRFLILNWSVTGFWSFFHNLLASFVLKSCSLSSICALVQDLNAYDCIKCCPGQCSAFTLQSNIFTFVAFLVKTSISAILGYRCLLLAVSCRLLIWHHSLFCIAEATEGRANPVHDRVVYVHIQSNVALVIGAQNVGYVSLRGYVSHAAYKLLCGRWGHHARHRTHLSSLWGN